MLRVYMKEYDEGKKLVAALQSIVVDEKDSDCGTKLTKKMLITGKNKDLFMYRYILERGKLIFLDEKNIDNYIDKYVNLRTPLYCNSDKYCSKCTGELYNMLGISNVGLLTTRIGTSLLNASLKAFHDMTLKTVKIDIDKYID